MGNVAQKSQRILILNCEQNHIFDFIIKISLQCWKDLSCNIAVLRTDFIKPPIKFRSVCKKVQLQFIFTEVMEMRSQIHYDNPWPVDGKRHTCTIVCSRHFTPISFLVNDWKCNLSQKSENEKWNCKTKKIIDPVHATPTIGRGVLIASANENEWRREMALAKIRENARCLNRYFKSEIHLGLILSVSYKRAEQLLFLYRSPQVTLNIAHHMTIPNSKHQHYWG